MKYLIIGLMIIFLSCSDVTEQSTNIDNNYWYIGYSSSTFIGRTDDPIHVFTSALQTLNNVWTYSHSNYGYSIICKYPNKGNEITGNLVWGEVEYSIPMFRVTLDDKTYYVSRRLGPTGYEGIDSSDTQWHGKPIMFVSDLNLFPENADSVATVLEVDPQNSYLEFHFDSNLIDHQQ